MADAMTAPRFQGDPPTHFVSPLLEEAGVPHLFTTRNFPGVTAFREPFPPLGPEAQPLLAGCGLDTEPAAFLKQVHGADVIRATEGGCVGNADVVMTDRPGLPIAVFSADCVPLLIYDPDGRRLAAAHAGWRGTAQSVARAAVEALVEAGGRPERFLAAVGPSIGPCCYEVDKPVIARLDQAFSGRWGAWVRSVGLGKWMLDLWAANEAELRGAGLRGDRIDNPRLCTGCRTDLFYSYRRGHKGRLVSVAAVPPHLRPPHPTLSPSGGEGAESNPLFSGGEGAECNPLPSGERAG
jgi:YfiH family protein